MNNPSVWKTLQLLYPQGTNVDRQNTFFIILIAEMYSDVLEYIYPIVR